MVGSDPGESIQQGGARESVHPGVAREDGRPGRQTSDGERIRTGRGGRQAGKGAAWHRARHQLMKKLCGCCCKQKEGKRFVSDCKAWSVPTAFNIVVVVVRFYAAPFSALEQTHCSLVACEC